MQIQRKAKLIIYDRNQSFYLTASGDKDELNCAVINLPQNYDPKEIEKLLHEYIDVEILKLKKVSEYAEQKLDENQSIVEVFAVEIEPNSSLPNSLKKVSTPTIELRLMDIDDKKIINLFLKIK